MDKNDKSFLTVLIILVCNIVVVSFVYLGFADACVKNDISTMEMEDYTISEQINPEHPVGALIIKMHKQIKELKKEVQELKDHLNALRPIGEGRDKIQWSKMEEAIDNWEEAYKANREDGFPRPTYNFSNTKEKKGM